MQMILTLDFACDGIVAQETIDAIIKVAEALILTEVPNVATNQIVQEVL